MICGDNLRGPSSHRWSRHSMVAFWHLKYWCASRSQVIIITRQIFYILSVQANHGSLVTGWKKNATTIRFPSKSIIYYSTYKTIIMLMSFMYTKQWPLSFTIDCTMHFSGKHIVQNEMKLSEHPKDDSRSLWTEQNLFSSFFLLLLYSAISTTLCFGKMLKWD